jgi:hypothetical protein
MLPASSVTGATFHMGNAMSSFYSDEQRELQDVFATRGLADRLQEMFLHATFSDEDVAFIAARDFFFLATVDTDGHPTVSYKGGRRGFVTITNNRLRFPCFDGNGMFLSMGNIKATNSVGLLFIDFEAPKRLRVQGAARLVDSTVPGALAFVEIEPTSIFVNCPRYIPRYARIPDAKHAPREDGTAPVAEWKRLDALQDVLPAADKMAVDTLGTLSFEEAVAKFNRGEG